MADFLINLASLSLGGAVVIGLLGVVARYSRGEYAARWRCWVWLILALRLLVPASLLQENQSAPIQLQVPELVVEQPSPQEPSKDSEGNSETDKGATQPNSELPGLSHAKHMDPWRLIGMIWLTGVLATGGWALMCHLRFLAYVRRWGERVEDPESVRCFNEVGDELALKRRPALRSCKGLKAPMLAGMFRTVLLLPEKPLDRSDLRYAFLHELIHFKRRDIWLKSAVLLACCLHWFNPALWYMGKLVERDTELACDEAVLDRLPPEEHAAYGRTILNAVERLNTVS